MRSVLFALTLLLAGCSIISPQSATPHVLVPDTPQAQQCSGACQRSYETCQADCGTWLNLVTSICRTPCQDARRQCLAYCPGAQPTGS